MKLSAKTGFWVFVCSLALISAGCQSAHHSSMEDAKFPTDPAAPAASGMNAASTTPSVGVESTPKTIPPSHNEEIFLREGDVVKIGVPSTPGLTGGHVIRRDGNITLEMVGDIRAAGKNLAALKADLLKAYADKIDTKEITVELESGKFPVFVTGAVMHAGRVDSDHPLTALEAVMECGGFDFGHANMKTVKISRLENGKYKSFTVNLKDELEGRTGNPFYLKPQDIVYVPERFVWF